LQEARKEHVTGQSRQRFREGGAFEAMAGYSRAVRIGQLIAVSGTTARPEVLGLGTRAQALDCLERIVAAVERLGGSRDGIYRTRIFLAPGADWREAGSAHHEVLADAAPANTTLFVHSLIGDGVLVEAEADAWAEVPQATGAVGSQDPE
jgi:enamine deaminase RidA (YjgF/YER057c/UK114 family)